MESPSFGHNWKIISPFYKAILSLNPNSWPTFLTKWERDLKYPLTDDQCSITLWMAHTSVISSKFADTNSKLLTRWHYTPASLHRVSRHFWALLERLRDCSHWWQFSSHSSPFWSPILHWISVIQGTPLPDDPWVVLFHFTGEHSSPPHLLNAAKSLQGRNGKKHQPWK